MTFCQQKIATSCDLSTQRGRDSALLWKLLVLLCRQNGVGTDPFDLCGETSENLYVSLDPVAALGES